MLELNQEDRIRLRNLNNDIVTVGALKKLFLNIVIKSEPGSDVEMRAAERTAVEFIKRAFHELSLIKPNEALGNQKENPI